MINYAKFLDDEDGVRSATYENGFNNILFSTELIVGKQINGTLNKGDIELYESHLRMTEAPDGGYIHKNSHDNITAKIIGSDILGLTGVQKDMKLIPLLLDIGIYRIWDVVLYTFLLGGFLGRLLARPFMFIPALQMIQACWKEGKLRPHFYERILWTLKGIKYNKVMYQNDGKILSPLKLYILVDKSLTMKYTAKICQHILVKRYGENYMYELFANYFKEEDHPVRLAWKDIGKIF